MITALTWSAALPAAAGYKELVLRGSYFPHLLLPSSPDCLGSVGPTPNYFLPLSGCQFTISSSQGLSLQSPLFWVVWSQPSFHLKTASHSQSAAHHLALVPQVPRVPVGNQDTLAHKLTHRMGN